VSRALYGNIQLRTGVRQGDPLCSVLFNMVINSPLRNIGERCRDSNAIHAFSDDGNYIIKIVFAPFVYLLNHADTVSMEDNSRKLSYSHSHANMTTTYMRGVGTTKVGEL
jgi:hypothetical protein